MTSHNRQATKTREAIRTAFTELVFSCRYDEIRMGDIAREANVGRSTLYLHYRDKDSVLLDNMAPLLGDIAAAITGEGTQESLEAALAHIWSHRDRGRVVLFGVTGQKLETAFAQMLTEIFDTRANTIALPFIANPISALTFSILRTWVRGEASATVSEISRHICVVSQAALAAARLSE